MRLLLDTHVLLWAADESDRLRDEAREMIDDPRNDVVVSAASLWEIAIKAARRRATFAVDAGDVRRGAVAAGYSELPISSDHVLIAAALPRIHDDPFDRVLVAQARHEGMLLLTADRALAAYGEPVRLV